MRDIRNLVAESPIIVKGDIVQVRDAPDKKAIFGFQQYLKERGATKEATIRIASTIKGNIGKNEAEVLFVASDGLPFTNLEVGKSYILFLSDVNSRLQFYDPANGGFRVGRGKVDVRDEQPMAKIRAELEQSLNSQDDRTIQTALLGLVEVGHRVAQPFKRFLAHPSAEVRVAAISACLRFGQWDLVEDAVHILESPSSNVDKKTYLGISSLSPMDSLSESVGSIRNANAVPLVVRLTKTCKSEQVRCELLESLANMGDKRSAPIFLQMLDDPDSEKSYRAYRALVKMAGMSSYVGDHVFSGERKASEIAKVRRWAESSLREAGDVLLHQVTNEVGSIELTRKKSAEPNGQRPRSKK
jgi:hypothetical protein